MSLRMGRQLSRFALFCFMLYSLTNLSAQFAGGTGTLEDPYLIETAAHLYNVHYHLDACYRQIADIDLGVAPYNQGEGWLPIGDSLNLPNAFSGRYNGSGHTISNLYMHSTNSIQGLFGGTNNAFIDSVNLINVDIRVYHYSGGLVGYANSTSINDCHVSGEIIGGLYTGGLAGQCEANTTITGCSSAGSVLGDTYVGGLVGNLISGTIIQSISSVNMIVGLPGSNIGLLIGKASDSLINECHTSGELSEQYATYVGSLIGYTENTDVNNCYTLGDVTGYQYVGGLCGVLLDSNTINCYTFGDVTGSMYTGGLIGFASESLIEKSYSKGNIWGHDPINIGGLIGTLRYSTLNNSYACGNISVSSLGIYIGGLCGFSEQSSINNCYSIGAVSPCEVYGGLIGSTNLDCNTLNSYWNTDTSGCTSSYGGEGRTTDDMTYPFAANTYVGWDFTNVWRADIETNSGYPYLNNLNVTANEDEYSDPIPVVLASNYPNPFCHNTNIKMTLYKNSKVELSIYNLKGQKICSLADDNFSKGEHSFQWNGKTSDGKALACGMYLYKLKGNGFEITRKMTLMK